MSHNHRKTNITIMKRRQFIKGISSLIASIPFVGNLNILVAAIPHKSSPTIYHASSAVIKINGIPVVAIEDMNMPDLGNPDINDQQEAK